MRLHLSASDVAEIVQREVESMYGLKALETIVADRGSVVVDLTDEEIPVVGEPSRFDAPGSKVKR